MLAALGGVLQTARIGAASPQVGEAILFDAAAAVLLGGTSFAGGIGGVGGTAVGVLFLATLQNGLSVSGVEAAWQQIITGGSSSSRSSSTESSARGSSAWASGSAGGLPRPERGALTATWKPSGDSAE